MAADGTYQLPEAWTEFRLHKPCLQFQERIQVFQRNPGAVAEILGIRVYAHALFKDGLPGHGQHFLPGLHGDVDGKRA